ncbi:MAG: ComEC/Rec2 family competence protein [Cyanobacteria bacterium P01_F01_bin.86]
MTVSISIVLCIAYIAGLLCTGIDLGTIPVRTVSLSGSGVVACVLVLLFALAAPRRWQLRLHRGSWLGVAGVVLLAVLYITVRSPYPGPQDISHAIERAQTIASTHIISGRVADEPRLNRSLKGRFQLAVEQLKVEDAEGTITFQIPVHGRVYVTAPLLQVTGLHAGEWVRAEGQLYRPQAAMNPGGFDFQTYLASRRTFAGFVAQELRFAETPGWGLWRIRQRIVRTQVRALGSPLGQLVSAMALGRRAVDLPFDIQDLFARVGLAHTIAASGFHVSLLLGSVLAIVRSQTGKVKLTVGLLVLAAYLTLTGLQPSVMRASLMGAATLLGLFLERKVKPLGALLGAVTLLLIWDPTWIWNIGFQLSVAATLGLIVMVSPLTKSLDWLPVTVSSLIAVPIAATLWTLPLMLYHFNVIAGLSIVLNTITTPLIMVLSLGGIGSSTLALVSPFIGGLVASLLYYPGQILLWLARTSSQLPGSAIAIGQISLWQLIGLYAVLILSLGNRRQITVRRLLPAGFLGLLLLPMGWQIATQHQITVLAAGDELIWIQQDHGHATLVNSGGEKTAFYTVQPFLQQAGINRLETAIALPSEEDYLAGWRSLLQQTPSLNLYSNRQVSPLPEVAGDYKPLPVGQSTVIGTLTTQLLGTENPILRLATPQQTWLLLPALPLALQDHLAQAGSVLQSQVLVWHGDELSAPLLAAVQPEVVICYGRALPQFVERKLQSVGIQVYWTARDGAITWRNRAGFHSYLERKHRNALL